MIYIVVAGWWDNTELIRAYRARWRAERLAKRRNRNKKDHRFYEVVAIKLESKR